MDKPDKDAKQKYRFGAKLREVRERRGFTLREVAEKAGVSESLVSQIERDKVSPAIDTLLSLAGALDLDLEYLFSDYRKNRFLQLVRRDERRSFSRPGVVYQRLARVEGREGIEAYFITVEEGARSSSSEYGHQGWELGVVVSGRAELEVGGEKLLLEKGDSAGFSSASPHVLKNSGREKLEVFWVITPPKDEIGRNA